MLGLNILVYTLGFDGCLQLKESAGRSTDLQHQLEKAKQQHQELQALQQNTNGKLRESQVLSSGEASRHQRARR